MEKLQLYSEVALTRTVRGTSLRAGDVAVLLEIVPHPAGAEDGAVLNRKPTHCYTNSLMLN
jgi:hypothetical protein